MTLFFCAFPFIMCRGSDTTNQGVGALAVAVNLFDDNIYVGGFNYAMSFTFAGKVVANNGNSGTGDMTIVAYSKDGNGLWAKVRAAFCVEPFTN